MSKVLNVEKNAEELIREGDNKNRTNPRAKVHGICRAVFGIENCRTKVRGIKPTIFNNYSVYDEFRGTINMDKNSTNSRDEVVREVTLDDWLRNELPDDSLALAQIQFMNGGCKNYEIEIYNSKSKKPYLQLSQYAKDKEHFKSVEDIVVKASGGKAGGEIIDTPSTIYTTILLDKAITQSGITDLVKAPNDNSFKDTKITARYVNVPEKWYENCYTPPQK